MKNRYAGAKGVVSIDPRVGSDHHLCIRPNMDKCVSEHRCFEFCQISVFRSLNLNRQAILLLSHRLRSDAVFFILQQQNHLTLIRALLRNERMPKIYLMKNYHPGIFSAISHNCMSNYNTRTT